jgi:tRNA(fMet)-specific endonuclease VapC
MRHLLDTNILSAMLRNPSGHVARRVRDARVSTVQTSIICAGELRFGAEKLGLPELSGRIDRLLASLEVLPFSAPAERLYGEIRARLETLGAPIGSNDMLIAAHALATDSILVTDNTREFSRVPGLRIENWLREQPASTEA